MKNGVRIKTDFIMGYGGPDGYDVRVIFQNKLLEKHRLRSEYDQGYLVAKLEDKYDKMTIKSLKTLAKTKDDASPFCDHCGGDTVDGCTSCVEKYFCNNCRVHIDGYIAKWHKEQEKLMKKYDERRSSQGD